jgi:hypothetical protein
MVITAMVPWFTVIKPENITKARMPRNIKLCILVGLFSNYKVTINFIVNALFKEDAIYN